LTSIAFSVIVARRETMIIPLVSSARTAIDRPSAGRGTQDVKFVGAMPDQSGLNRPGSRGRFPGTALEATQRSIPVARNMAAAVERLVLARSRDEPLVIFEITTRMESLRRRS